MTNQFKIRLLTITTALLALICSPVNARTIDHVDSLRLQQAGNFIRSKHYHKGYISFRNMAKHGCPYSQCILGIMHQKGLGTEKSSAQAFYWFQKSAQQGFADAEQRLGLMYYHGDGIKKNLTLAKLWLTRAADHGVIAARQLLAQIPPIPGQQNLSNQLAQAPQQAAWTVNNIKESWQGYSEVTKQLSQLSSLAQPQ